MNAKWTLGLAVLAGLVAVVMVQRHIGNLRGETITVFKATSDQVAGEILGSAVEEVAIPSGLFPNVLQEAPSGDLVDFVQTTKLRESVRAGDMLLFRHFDSAVDPGVLPDIPPGMKAISLAANEVNSVAFFVQPGDLVDVLATFLGDEEAAGPQANSQLFDFSTRPIVQAARVLAVGGQHRPTDRQLREPYSSVTLLVSMDEAAKLIFARDFFNASMTLVLRGEGDTRIESQIPKVGVQSFDFDKIGNTPKAVPTQ